MKDCETKYRIMETALELIWQSSYESVGVNDICQKAKVNKGSFYHFFESKEVLAAEAINFSWERFQPMLDQVFSAQKKPIKRLLDYCDFMVQMQKEKMEKTGKVCGCPYTNIGLEQSPQSKIINEKIQNCFSRTKKYFISAIKEAKEAGDIDIKDANHKADELYTVCLGALTQARINNDLKCLINVKNMFEILLGLNREVAGKI